MKVAALDPFQGYKNAIDDQLEDAVTVLDAFHVVKLATHAVDKCRRRIQQEIAIAARPDEHLAVCIAWSCAQQLRSAYRHPDPS